jgi:hypothetical protein
VTFYKAGTSSVAQVYKDNEQNEAWPNGVATLDAGGRATVYVDRQVDAVFEDQDGAVVLTAERFDTFMAKNVEFDSPTWTATTVQEAIDKITASTGGPDALYVPKQIAGLTGGKFSDEIAEHALNVRRFGATGDGSTDDTAAIQAVFAWIQNNQSGGFAARVIFPKGIYRCSSTLTCTAPVIIEGHGKYSSVLQFNADVDGLSLTGSGSVVRSMGLSREAVEAGGGKAGILATGIAGFTVEDCSVVSTADNNGFDYGLSLVNCSGVRVVGSEFETRENGSSDGIRINSCFDVGIIGNSISTSFTNDAIGTNIRMTTGACGNIYIANNRLFAGGTMIRMDITALADGVTITGNRFGVFTTAIEAPGSSTNVTLLNNVYQATGTKMTSTNGFAGWSVWEPSLGITFGGGFQTATPAHTGTFTPDLTKGTTIRLIAVQDETQITLANPSWSGKELRLGDMGFTVIFRGDSAKGFLIPNFGTEYSPVTGTYKDIRTGGDIADATALFTSLRDGRVVWNGETATTNVCRFGCTNLSGGAVRFELLSHVFYGSNVS